jgi:hypothetical protein
MERRTQLKGLMLLVKGVHGTQGQTVEADIHSTETDTWRLTRLGRHAAAEIGLELAGKGRRTDSGPTVGGGGIRGQTSASE